MSGCLRNRDLYFRGKILSFTVWFSELLTLLMDLDLSNVTSNCAAFSLC